jgi:hypothetical protein
MLKFFLAGAILLPLVAMPPEAEAKKSKKHNRGEFLHLPRRRFKKPKPPINFGIPAPKGARPNFGTPMPKGGLPAFDFGSPMPRGWR